MKREVTMIEAKGDLKLSIGGDERHRGTHEVEITPRRFVGPHVVTNATARPRGERVILGPWCQCDSRVHQREGSRTAGRPQESSA